MWIRKIVMNKLNIHKLKKLPKNKLAQKSIIIKILIK